MKQFLALYLIAVGAVYSDLESNELIQGYLLPVIFVVSAVYLFTPTGSVILFTAGICFYFTDVLSPSLFRSIVLPCLFGISLLVFLCWASKAGHFRGTYSSNGGGSSGSGFGDGGSGGDCGGGGDC